uniref:taste receptor type 2 member 104-like n=1 Tax=Euleptes europaea TaxID=460621 RepID=UPI0025408BBE|nr:taste receptor type 2 member 104-like [Euleptes europaea]
MSTLLSVIGFSLLIMETLIGMGANGFIVLVNTIDWLRSRKLFMTDLILTSLGLARLVWLAVAILYVAMHSFFLDTYLLDHVHLMFTIMWLFTNNVNFWFAAYLGVWYLTKIAIFSHPVFLQVKRSFSLLVPWLLLGSVVLSAFMTIIIITGLKTGSSIYNPFKSLVSNSNESEIRKPPFIESFIILAIVQNVIPLVLFVFSIIFLIISLWKHMRHLQRDGVSTSDLNTKAHLTAIKALVSFAILYLFSFAAIVSESTLTWEMKNPALSSVFFNNVSALYPSGHAIILILLNPKLKQAWVRVMHHLKCHLREAPSF